MPEQKNQCPSCRTVELPDGARVAENSLPRFRSGIDTSWIVCPTCTEKLNKEWIGRFRLLCNNPRPSDSHKKPDRFVAVRVTGWRVELGDWGDYAFCDIARALDGQGDFEGGVFREGIVPIAGSFWYQRESEGLWYDVVRCTGSMLESWRKRIPQEPFFVRGVAASFMRYCVPHGRVYYLRDGCDVCAEQERDRECLKKYPPPKNAERAWNGWF